MGLPAHLDVFSRRSLFGYEALTTHHRGRSLTQEHFLDAAEALGKTRRAGPGRSCQGARTLINAPPDGRSFSSTCTPEIGGQDVDLAVHPSAKWLLASCSKSPSGVTRGVTDLQSKWPSFVRWGFASP